MDSLEAGCFLLLPQCLNNFTESFDLLDCIDFMRVLVHDLRVHVSDVILQQHMVIAYRGHLVLVLL